MIDIDLDYITSERAAAGMARGLDRPQGSWGELIATAQAIVGLFQEYTPGIDGPLSIFYNQESIAPLIAAARILDSASQPMSGIEDASSQQLAILGATAFAMYGNFASATAAVRRLIGNIHLSPSLAAVLGTCAPSLIGKLLLVLPDASVQRTYLEKLGQFLRTGSNSDAVLLRSLLVESILAADSSLEGSLLRSCRLALAHLEELSTARNLRPYSELLSTSYINRLVESGVVTLFPPQYEAIKQAKILEREGNAVLALPTSTGKTFIAELCLVAAFGSRPGVACYIAPYVALGRQVAEKLEKHTSGDFRIHKYVGGFTTFAKLMPDVYREIVVATPEAFDGFLRSSLDISSLRAVVVDEAHLIENGSRGCRLEGVITRLKLLNAQGARFRMLFLSAVISDLNSFCHWLDIPPDLVIKSSWKPTARRLAFWRQGGTLDWVLGDDPVRRQGNSDTQVIGRRLIPWPETKLWPTQNYGASRAQEPSVARNVAYLAEVLRRTLGSPVLCACSTKQGTRTVARALAERFEEDLPSPPEIEKVISLIEAKYSHMRFLASLLRHGVAYHNSTVPHDVRAGIEDAARSRCIKAIAATTTLAEGVDLPFRVTILVDWLSWGGGVQAPMSPLTFRNIAGRCGRAGSFTEGDTIIFDNPLGNVAYAHPSYRQTYQKTLLSPIPTMKSALMAASASAPRSEERATLGSQFLAAIPENPHTPSLASVFAENTYAAALSGSGATISPIMEAIEADVLDESRGALARAASPLKLTPLGEAANNTGFSPNSCRAILSYLQSMPESESFVEVAADVLRQLGLLPEQSHSGMRKILSAPKARFPVKPDDFEELLHLWISKVALVDIFGSLPYVRRSKKKVRFELWQSGEQVSDEWASDFDKFTEFVVGIFESFLPWLLRACGNLAHFAGGHAERFDWWGAAKAIGSRKEQAEESLDIFLEA